MSKFIPIPSHILSENDLKDLFKPLLNVLNSKRKTREENDRKGHAVSKKPRSQSTDNADDLQEHIVQIGSKMKIYWSKEELQETDWRVGWYSATVHSYVDHNLFCQIGRIVTLNNKQKIKLRCSPYLSIATVT